MCISYSTIALITVAVKNTDTPNHSQLNNGESK